MAAGLEEDPAGETEVGADALAEAPEDDEAAEEPDDCGDDAEALPLLLGVLPVCESELGTTLAELLEPFGETEVEAGVLLAGLFCSTGQTVVETAMTEVVVMVEWAGQLVTEAAQLVMTLVCVEKTVEVVMTGAAEELALTAFRG